MQSGAMATNKEVVDLGIVLGWLKSNCLTDRSGHRPYVGCLIPIRIKNDNCVASPCRAAALSAASRLVLLSNANWNYRNLYSLTAALPELPAQR